MLSTKPVGIMPRGEWPCALKRVGAYAFWASEAKYFLGRTNHAGSDHYIIQRLIARKKRS